MRLNIFSPVHRLGAPGGICYNVVDKADGTVAFMEGDYSEDKGKADEAALSYVR